MIGPRKITLLLSCRCLAAFVAVALAVCGGVRAVAQELALGERQPFDRIYWKGGDPKKPLEVQPLELPGRKVPQPFPSGSLVLRLVDPSKGAGDLELPWNRIERIELYEQMLMDEARELTKAGKFDEAYFNFARLQERYPKTPGLDAALDFYLQSDALDAFKSSEYDRALAVLGSLHDRNPNAPGLAVAIDKVAGKIIEQYLAEKNYKAARLALDVVANNFGDLPLTVVDLWRGQFEQAAAGQMKIAEQAFANSDFAAARRAIDQAVGVWPEIPGSQSLQRKIQAANPQVAVGVFEAAPEGIVFRLDSWPHARTSQLIEPMLAELVDYSPEGGIYTSPVGEITTDPTGLEVTITVEPRPGFDEAELAVGVAALARDLLLAASGDLPGASPTLARLVRDVELQYPNQVRIKLARAHVRPESLLRLPMPRELQVLTGQLGYKVVERDGNMTLFDSQAPKSGTPSGGMSEVREVLFENEDDALSALVRGDIDVIDRVPPWQVAKLGKIRELSIEPYKLPTVHVLVPTRRQPLLERREFRRALCYAIDRDGIVERIILGGESSPGYQAVSAPFAARDSLSEIVPYAYNSAVRPREYDIRLAAMLLNVAWSGVQPKVPKGEEPSPLPPLPGLVMAHSTDPVVRATCQAIKQQLGALGLNLELIEMTADELTDPALEGVDLKYVELMAWEPVTDARDLLGVDGIIPADSDFLLQSLDALDRANNWNDVRQEMFAMHRVASSELPVIPLWQTRNHFARRNYLQGLSSGSVTLYQDIPRWQMKFD